MLPGILALVGVVAVAIQNAKQAADIDDLSNLKSRVDSLESHQTSMCLSVC